MPNQKEGMTLQKLVALLENPDFIAEAKDYHKKYTAWYLKTAPIEGERERQLPGFNKDVIDPFIKKWGAFPPEKNLLVSSSRYKTHYAIMTGLWGLIPVFPWTTRQEIEKQARQIHRAIGRKHKDFMENRRAQIAEWLSWHRHSVTDKAPRPRDIAAVVWGRTKGLKRPSKAQGVSKMSFEREQELMKRHKDKGKTRREAQRLVIQQVRGKEAPASAMVRMAKRRMKREQTELEKKVRDPRKTDKSGYALTMLLREILFSPFVAPPNFEYVHAKAANLANILTGFESPISRT